MDRMKPIMYQLLPKPMVLEFQTIDLHIEALAQTNGTNKDTLIKNPNILSDLDEYAEMIQLLQARLCVLDKMRKYIKSQSKKKFEVIDGGK